MKQSKLCFLLVQEEWIELESRKFGNFFFNKQTGETFLPPSLGAQPPAAGAQPPAVETQPPSEPTVGVADGDGGEGRGGREETDGPRRARRRVRHYSYRTQPTAGQVLAWYLVVKWPPCC